MLTTISMTALCLLLLISVGCSHVSEATGAPPPNCDGCINTPSVPCASVGTVVVETQGNTECTYACTQVGDPGLWSITDMTCD